MTFCAATRLGPYENLGVRPAILRFSNHLNFSVCSTGMGPRILWVISPLVNPRHCKDLASHLES